MSEHNHSKEGWECLCTNSSKNVSEVVQRCATSHVERHEQKVIAPVEKITDPKKTEHLVTRKTKSTLTGCHSVGVMIHSRNNTSKPHNIDPFQELFEVDISLK